MAEKNVEKSPSGLPIIRYEQPTREFRPAIDTPDYEKIKDHIEKYIGKIETVHHEILSEIVHIDVHLILPDVKRKFITLITSGMSYLPMAAPQEAKECKYAELFICLPTDWPLGEESLKDDRNYWPIRWLRFMARFPHEYNTWLWGGHTIPNGDPPQSLAKNTKLSGFLLAPPLILPKEFYSLKIDDNKTIYFFSILPLYKEEMDLKLKRGLDPLYELLDKYKVNELLDVGRPNVCKKPFWLF